MKTSSIILCLSVLGVTGLFPSCLKEKECPVEAASLFTAVKEKNYENVAEIAQAVPVDENLPFSRYVGSLEVTYEPVGASLPALRGRFATTGEQREYALDVQTLPAAQYGVTLIGNLAQENISAEGSGRLYELHPANAESADLYLGRDTLTLPLSSRRVIPLTRTKGKLMLLYEHFPDDIARVELRADGVAGSLDSRLEYAGTTQVVKSFPLPAGQTSGQLEMLLAPTQVAPGTLSVALYGTGTAPVVVFSNIELAVQRNRISAIRMVYDPAGNTWQIWSMLEGEWIRLHDLTIE